MTLPERPAWQARAACRGLTDLFFLDEPVTNVQAKELCLRCPVRTQCLNYILEQHTDVQTYGIWAATSTSQRRKIRAIRAERKRLAS